MDKRKYDKIMNILNFSKSDSISNNTKKEYAKSDLLLLDEYIKEKQNQIQRENDNLNLLEHFLNRKKHLICLNENGNDIIQTIYSLYENFTKIKKEIENIPNENGNQIEIMSLIDHQENLFFEIIEALKQLKIENVKRKAVEVLINRLLNDDLFVNGFLEENSKSLSIMKQIVKDLEK
jgi:hypothetical protein